jgi:hypothetical protein
MNEIIKTKVPTSKLQAHYEKLSEKQRKEVELRWEIETSHIFEYANPAILSKYSTAQIQTLSDRLRLEIAYDLFGPGLLCD